jgi:protein arginine kinase
MSPLTKSFFPAWLTKKSPSGSKIVISTRIRLARNFSDMRFLPEAGPDEKARVLERVGQFAATFRQPALTFQKLRELDEVHRGVLAERGLVNLDSATDPGAVGLATGPGQNISLLVNEEDHLRLQVMLEGLNLPQGLKLAKELDEQLGKAFPLAIHSEFGFLTACPTNVGTGLRASVMLHLPGLALTRGIVQVLQAVLHIGLAVRGFYGEGTELRSVFFQVSNQMTLGRTEEEIIQHLAGVTRQIVEREEEARQKLVKESPRLLEDKAGRAWGILSGCQLLGFEEALDLLSALRLGVETGVLEGTPHTLLNEMLILIQPAHIQLLADRMLSVEEQMVRRAELVKRHLKIGKKKTT